jgi:hypothetical protein
VCSVGCLRSSAQLGVVAFVPVQAPVAGERPANDLAEVSPFHPGAVLDQPKQVRAGRCHRPPDVVITEPVKFPEQDLAHVLQVPVQRLLLISLSHGQESCARRSSLSIEFAEPAVKLRHRRRRASSCWGKVPGQLLVRHWRPHYQRRVGLADR